MSGTNQALCYRAFGPPETTLQRETLPLSTPQPGSLRVKMLLSPVNASDLIPITGAYRHRITPPVVAGYEGVGVVTYAPPALSHLTGSRVLPLRGQGCWQQYVDCDPALAVPVPEDISDAVAARAYINPLAARLMLAQFPPVNKRLLLTAAGSDCAGLLGQWALRAGAREVVGVYRSPAHARALADAGIVPLAESDTALIDRCARRTDIAFDAVGGTLASRLLHTMPSHGQLVSYGLLSGQPFSQCRAPSVHWFHMRHALAAMTPEQWQAECQALWPLLRDSTLHDIRVFTLDDWQHALRHYRTPGRTTKPVLAPNAWAGTLT